MSGSEKGLLKEGGACQKKPHKNYFLWLVAVGLELRLSWGPNVKAFLHGQHYSGSKAVMPVKIFFFIL